MKTLLLPAIHPSMTQLVRRLQSYVVDLHAAYIEEEQVTVTFRRAELEAMLDALHILDVMTRAQARVDRPRKPHVKRLRAGKTLTPTRRKLAP